MQVVPENSHTTLIAPEKRCKDAKQCRLAAAVRPKHSEYFAGADFEVDVFECSVILIGESEAFHVYTGCGVH